MIPTKIYESLFRRLTDKKGHFPRETLCKNVWKIFVSESLVSYVLYIGFSGSFALFRGKDLSQKNEVLFVRQHFLQVILRVTFASDIPQMSLKGRFRNVKFLCNGTSTQTTS